ncbi:MAG: hypothetical protein RL572_1332 [Pseudomonadota bacterium]|jgi:putative hemolysin
MVQGNPLALEGLCAPLRFVLNKLSALDVLRDWYDERLRRQDSDSSRFLDFVLERLDADFQVHNLEVLGTLPADRPLIIVANHPLGALEGMYLSRLLLRYRPDLKVLTNELLLRFKEFNELFIGVDVLNPDRQQMNGRGMLQASRHLSRRGALLLFPSGTVSVLHLRSWSIQDAPWKDIVGRLALKYDATCLPIHVEGRNSWTFYLSGLIHKRLRTLLLPRAMLGQGQRRLTTRIGQPLRLTDTGIDSPQAATDYLRMACELLPLPQTSAVTDARRQNLLPADHDAAALQVQLTQMEDCLVQRHDSFDVYCAPWKSLGCVAQQLALVRERTFREVGEGTGMALDADRFDRDYAHILVWDREQRRLVGGYRAASVQQILERRGVEGLYSNSLFHYDARFLQALGGVVEVGRSFVSREYQSNPHALDLLWRGLGAFMLRHPDCHTFMGCVSISNHFAPMIRALLSDTFLAAHSAEASLRGLVRPVAPFRYSRRFWSPESLQAVSSMNAINKLLGNAGTARKVPVLIRHYLALNGKFIEFSVNHHFSKALDGLILVDLRTAPQRYLKRYLGILEDVRGTQLDSQWVGHFLALGDTGALVHIQGHSDEGIRLQECPMCGPTLVIRREQHAGDTLFCRNCTGAFVLQEDDSHTLRAVPTGGMGRPEDLEPDVDHSLISRSIRESLTLMPLQELHALGPR